MSGVRKLEPPTRGKWKERWAVDSDGLDNEYTVAVDASGNYGCSCPAWKFQRSKMLAKNPDWQCKHIEAVENWRSQPQDVIGRQIGDIQKLVAEFRKSVASCDYARIADVRVRLEAARGLSSACAETIDCEIATAEMELLNRLM